MQRAQKLKQKWIEEKKVKKAYRGAKKKAAGGSGSNEGVLDSGWPQSKTTGTSNEEMKVDTNTNLQPGPSYSASVKSSSVKSQSKQPDSEDKHNKPVTVDKSKEKDSHLEDTGESFRELKNRAYSRASLHTHRSDPLHRRQKDTHKKGVSKRNDERISYTKKGNGGQPNMRLRMATMLEEIKRSM